ncbi:uncharacterized protein TA14175 [Theileria annulata]|uniref:Uncharacterized protein n=1 Tax=Theileria annulata TaxID=5874 RepID=Q4UDD4_THEAN|nr:uncharacterized protein TA14175 [Theileria annulata]CAI74905.1 hypothetical protein TA14175 [Theileria annulata]|eukprot:XP_952637.1 hypothetical protein TA14175 [Theileria annulata]
MVGDGLFTMGEGRHSPASASYLEPQRNMTLNTKPIQTNYNHIGVHHNNSRLNSNVTPVTTNVKGGGTDFFDDPVTFVREFSSETLMVPEFSKFEKNVYKSRYLNTQECFALLNAHYKNLMNNYAPRVQTLVTQSMITEFTKPKETGQYYTQYTRSEVTFEALNEMSLFTKDHMKSLSILVVLGNHHNLNLEGLRTYVLNVMRLLYRAVTGSKSNQVEKSRLFYTFLTKYNNMGRAVVLYMLLLCTLEKLLWFSEPQLPYDDFFSVFAFIICSFVESATSKSTHQKDLTNNTQFGKDSVLTDKPGTSRKNDLIPAMASNTDMLVRHLSVVCFLLKLKVTPQNKSDLLESVRFLRNALRSIPNRNKNLLLWTSIMIVYLDPQEIPANTFKIPRSLFIEVGEINDMTQLVHLVLCLDNCFRDLKFSNFVESNINVSTFVQLFLFNFWKHVDALNEDLANEILLLANSVLDSYPNLVSVFAKYISQFTNSSESNNTYNALNPQHNQYNYNYREEQEKNKQMTTQEIKLSHRIQKSMEALFNIAMFGKSRLQMNAAVLASKLLMSSDVTTTLPRINKLKYSNSMLDLLNLSLNNQYTVNDTDYEYNTQYNNHTDYDTFYKDNKLKLEPWNQDKFVQDLTRLTLMSAFINHCWKELISTLMSKTGPKLFEYQKNRPHINGFERVDSGKLNKAVEGYDRKDVYKNYNRMEIDRVDGVDRESKIDGDVQRVLSYVRSLYLGSNATIDSLYSILFSGPFPAKVLSYEALRAHNSAPDTLVMCGMMTMYKSYPAFSGLFNQYLSNANSFSYSMTLTLNVKLQNRDLSNYMMMMLNTFITQYLNGCDMYKKSVVNGILNNNLPKSLVSKEKYNQMSKFVNEYKSENQRLRLENDQLKTDIRVNRSDYERTIASMKEELTKSSERYKSDLQNMKETLNKTSLNLNQVQDSLTAANAEITSLRHENGRILSERDSLKSEIMNLKSKISSQMKEFERLTSQIRELETTSAQFKHLQVEYDRIKEENAKTNSQLDSLYKMLIYLTDKYKSNMCTLDSFNDANKNLNQQVSHLKSKVVRLEKEVKDKQAEVSSLDASKNRTEGELKRMQVEMRKRDESLEASNRKVEDLRERVNRLTRELQDQVNQYNELKRENTNMQNELNVRRQQLDAIENAVNKRPIII